MSKVVTRWEIFKKSDGFPYPGEAWYSCKSAADARKIMRTVYGDDPIFFIVKITYERWEH